MIDKEISEVRRHLRRDRSNITHIYGCYVNDNKEIISEFKQSVGMMLCCAGACPVPWERI